MFQPIFSRTDFDAIGLHFKDGNGSRLELVPAAKALQFDPDGPTQPENVHVDVAQFSLADILGFIKRLFPATPIWLIDSNTFQGKNIGTVDPILHFTVSPTDSQFLIGIGGQTDREVQVAFGPATLIIARHLSNAATTAPKPPAETDEAIKRFRQAISKGIKQAGLQVTTVFGAQEQIDPV